MRGFLPGALVSKNEARTGVWLMFYDVREIKGMSGRAG
jgi:hypothetical protein